MIDQLLIAAVDFLRNLIGIVARPYETYRRIVERGGVAELVYIAALCACYFALASLVRATSFRPFLLTKQFLLLAAGSGSGFLLTVFLLWLVGRLVGGEGKLGSLGVAWAYTLIPTVLWFLATSLLYVILPPPRTTSFMGVAFSIVFLVFSATLLWWKITLAYLTLRFGMKLDLIRIAAVVLLTSPVLGGWGYLMYRLGIFKVPFL